MVKGGAKVYICGSGSGLTKDVRRTWEEHISMQMCCMTEVEARVAIGCWIHEGYYIEDIWGWDGH